MRAAVGRWLLLAALLVPTPARCAAEFEPVAPGAYVLSAEALAAQGAPAETGNVGLLVGDAAALLVDTGASYRQGREVLAALRRATDRPPRLALVSHALPEFLFGAAALQDAGLRVVAQPDSAKLIAQRCQICLDRAIAQYGAEAMAGTRVPVLESSATGDWQVDLGGRQVEVLDFGWASTPGSVGVFDRASGTLYAGGVVLAGRVPMLRDADFDGWVAALGRIARLPVRRVVPGHGPVVTLDAVAQLRAYLLELDAEVRRLYASGASLPEAVAEARLPAYATWVGYPELHRQNVHYRYLAVEREDFDAAAGTSGR
ncbi:MBL fold metallo-hydrolase [Azoarcus sp. DN11]|uniref:MBL fold metallo-hydrolase n=1 Tax=Azoarcus sp. DN11 TaxID=356837 RepID=UPI000EAF43BB|nr:MBL fold metallo-hydrolase [Azoarcus sp. DN11]AYH44001.1 MBL fold metallo-hydrolase [Azoarcus sp. DN11]